MVRHNHIPLELAIALHSMGVVVEYSHRWAPYDDSKWHRWQKVVGEPTRDWDWALQQDIQVRFRVVVED